MEIRVLPYDHFRATQQRTVDWLRTGIVLALVLPLVFFIAVASYRYRQLHDEARHDADRISRIVGEHALKLLDTNKVLLERLLDLVDGNTDAELEAREGDLHRKLRSMVDSLPQVQSAWVLNADGHPVLTNRFYPAPRDLDLKDRESFIAHRDGYEGVFVTGALIGKRTKELFFDITRRRNHPDGRFAGTVQVSLYPRYLTDFYNEVVGRDSGLTITLVRDDGAMIARWPEAMQPDMRKAPYASLLAPMQEGRPSGFHTGPSSIDGVTRQVAYRKIGNYPVYAYAGFSTESIVARWRSEMLLLGALVFAFAGALVLAGSIALRSTRRGLDIARRLDDETRQRQKVEEVLRHAQKMEALGHLTGGVAHDFNNLLMIVDMNTQLLRHTLPELAKDRRLDAIEHAVATGARLTRQLLSFSRRQALVPRTLRPAESLPALADLCRPVLGPKVEVTIDVPPDTPAIRVDQAELELAMINLAVNARHAMPDGGRFRISVRTVHADEPGIRLVEIAVRDTGSGIAPEHLDRVFDPFFTTKKTGEGTGLGLSQVYGMCSAAGGTARVESRLGEGTTVILSLPAAAGDHPTTLQVGAPSTVKLDLHVLLVEDNDEIARAAEQALHFLGCTAVRCVNGDQAIALLSKDHRGIDFVLSDAVMPGVNDGIALARHIRARYPSLPIALMTGYSDKLVDAEAMGIPVFPKPFSIGILRGILAGTLVQ